MQEKDAEQDKTMMIRFRIKQILDGKALIIPLADETLIPVPVGLDIDQMQYTTFRIDVTPDNLVVDEPWDIEHKTK
jgi:hypothetical protein